MSRHKVFTDDFLIALRALVNVHHSIYARIPPQGIYFEGLVEGAFRRIRKPFTLIDRPGKNQPGHDVLLEDRRLSIKTETGAGTHANQINITKLCTTEREPWEPQVLVRRVKEHLSRYDLILMLRAVWESPLIHYQLVEIPIRILKLIRSADLEVVGRRGGRQSLGADIYRGEQKLFHVHFDGSDGKCQIRNLNIEHCTMLLKWDLHIRD